MSVIIKKPWTRQPQFPIGVDRGNSLPRGIKYFWGCQLGGMIFDSVSNKHALFGSANTLEARTYGIVVKGTGGTTSNINITGCEPASYTNFTLIAKIQSPSFSGTQGIFLNSFNGGLSFTIDATGHLQLGQSYQTQAAASTGV